MNEESLGFKTYQANIEFWLERQPELIFPHYDILPDQTKELHSYVGEAIAQQIRQQSVSELDRLQKRIKRLEQERSYLDRLIGDAIYLIVRAIGDGLTHADKNVQICKAIYPLIQKIPVYLGARIHSASEDAEF